MMEIIGLAPHDVGKLDESHTIKLSTLWASQRELMTEFVGSSPILADAWQCADVRSVPFGLNSRSAQNAASSACWKRGYESGPMGSSDVRNTSSAPALNMISTPVRAAKRNRFLSSLERR